MLYIKLHFPAFKTPVQFDQDKFTIYPACIPDGSEVYEERTAWVTGYGAIATCNYWLALIIIPRSFNVLI